MATFDNGRGGVSYELLEDAADDVPLIVKGELDPVAYKLVRLIDGAHLPSMFSKSTLFKQCFAISWVHPEPMMREDAKLLSQKLMISPPLKMKRSGWKVEGDGTLVPATEDEAMEVECFLEDDKAHKVSKDGGQCSYAANTRNNLSMEDLPGSDDDDAEKNDAGLSEPEDIELEKQKLNAKMEFLDVMLQRVKEEERVRVASTLPDHCSSYLLSKTGWNHSNSANSEFFCNPVSNLLSEDAHFEEGIPLLCYGSAEEHALENLNMESPSLSTKSSTSKAADRSSPSLATTIPMSDLGAVKNDICLDKLTIRELHETFRTTFGRDTSVKDKQWLKRRISMGLREFHEEANNSVVLENKALVIGKQEEMSFRPGKRPADTSPYCDKIQATKSNMATVNSVGEVGRKRLNGKNSSMVFFADVAKTEFGISNDELPVGEETTGKRMRKPTRRYIEELSEVESRVNSGKPATAFRDSDQGYSPAKSRSRSYWNGFDGMALVCRQDSLGGSGIQVPFVFRVRRGRPRKNCTPLLKHKPSGRAAKLVKKALCVRAARCSSDNADMKQIVPIGSSQPFVHDNKENKEHMLLSVESDRHCVSEPLNSDSADDISDEYVTTIRTAKGGIRRKHHRSWTLHEVVKLVEGVSRFGVGRWSDIKKLAFSSSGYRTSVDLKDKWRNLLRASYAQLQTKKEAENRRKHASVPIPASILVRVRELSAMQPRTLCLPSSSNSISRSGRIVHKRHPM